MERLTEEKITKFLINYLKLKDFKIFSYDFPQSGTGYILRPNSTEIKHKNIGFWIPDIIAIKGQMLYLFENKDHYSISDIKKIQNISNEKTHSEAIEKLLYKTKTNNYCLLLCYPINFFNTNNKLVDSIDAEIGCDVINDTVTIKSNNTDLKTSLVS